MNYKSFNLGDWIGHISGVIADESELDGNEMRDLVEFLSRLPRWIPVKFRPLTEEEQKEYPDYCYMADCLMPSEDEEILVSTTHGTVEKDIAGFEDGFYLDSGYDWQTDIVAWMPLPEPYGEDGDAE